MGVEEGGVAGGKRSRCLELGVEYKEKVRSASGLDKGGVGTHDERRRLPIICNEFMELLLCAVRGLAIPLGPQFQ